MKSTRDLCRGAAIAAIYVVLTWLSSLMGLSSGIIQIRISEALCVLPAFTTSAVPGLAVGCVLANLLTGGNVIDVVFGSLATLLGAIGTYYLRKRPYLGMIPPVISNMIVIPLILKFAYQFEGSVFYFAFTVGIGEIISVCVLGTGLIYYLRKRQIKFK